MKVFIYDSVHCAILEQQEGSTEPALVAKEIRSHQDGILLASSLQLLELTRTAEKAFVWILENCNQQVLPEGLQPLRLHLLKARQVIAQNEQ